MKKVKVRTLQEAAQVQKRKRRTKKEMEAARAHAFVHKRTTVEAVYPAEGYPISLCAVCLSPFSVGQRKKRTMPDIQVKHGRQVFTIARPVYACAREECKTDVICYISNTMNQRDIAFFIDTKRLKGGKDTRSILHSGPKLLPVRPYNGQPNAQTVRGPKPDQASPKRRKVKRKQ